MPRLSIALALFVAFTLTTAARAEGPAEGTWTWERPLRRGDRPAQKYTLKLEQEGEKLTGTLTLPRRGQNDATPTEIDIKKGSVKDGTVAFNVTATLRDGREVTIKYSGKLDGDTIKGTETTPSREGQERKREWEAKRTK